jgi:hypothetical protein
MVLRKGGGIFGDKTGRIKVVPALVIRTYGGVKV